MWGPPPSTGPALGRGGRGSRPRPSKLMGPSPGIYTEIFEEDDERATDEDEAQITEPERREELAALQAEADLPLDDIPRMFTKKCRKDETATEIPNE